MQVNTKPDTTPVKQAAGAQTPIGIRIAGLVFRTLFIAVLIVATARVASPQNETLLSVYDTPADLIRLLIGFAVCAWFFVHLFILPKDAEGYRSWVYIGLAVLPLAVIMMIVIW